ncbi:MAG TPA: hypothetical protein VG013_36325 [Gemmataceae bacterium]|jgi:WD40 repeat protein|nr:hypothetical protein [Gemmataceae bacterium]
MGVAYSPDGRQILSCGFDDGVRLWEAATGEEVAHFDTGKTTCLAYSPDGRLAIFGTPAKGIRVWDLAAGKELRRLEGHTGSVWSVAFSRDGHHALSWSADKTVRWWDVDSGKQLRCLRGGGICTRSRTWPSPWTAGWPSPAAGT